MSSCGSCWVFGLVARLDSCSSPGCRWRGTPRASRNRRGIASILALELNTRTTSPSHIRQLTLRRRSNRRSPSELPPNWCTIRNVRYRTDKVWCGTQPTPMLGLGIAPGHLSRRCSGSHSQSDLPTRQGRVTPGEGRRLAGTGRQWRSGGRDGNCKFGFACVLRRRLHRRGGDGDDVCVGCGG